MITKNTTQLGVSAHVEGFDVVTLGNRFAVLERDRVVCTQDVPGLATFISRPGAIIRLRLARNEDYTVFTLYDQADDNYGYALNVTAPDLSEWGYASPCPATDRTRGCIA